MKTLVLLVLTIFTIGHVFQAGAAPERRATAVDANATPQPTPTPKRGLFERIFKPGKRPIPTATPKPVETPKPKPRRTPKPTPTPEEKETPQPKRTPKAKETPEEKETPKPKSTPKSKETPEPTPKDVPTPKPPKPTPTPKAKPTPTPESAATAKPAPVEKMTNDAEFVPPAVTPAPAVVGPGPDEYKAERTKYLETREKAEKDSAVAKLREAAELATTPEAIQQAERAYYEALFGKMRKLEPSIKARIDSMEKATLNRLGPPSE